MAWYLDTSALAWLVVAEPESECLRAWLLEQEREPVAADLVRAELIRAVRRAAPELMLQARAVLDAVTLLGISSSVFEEAGRLDPVDLRSLDAIHLAAALDLGDELEGLVAYDRRLISAAESNGIRCESPD